LLKPGGLNAEQDELYERPVENHVPWADKSGFKVIDVDGSLLMFC
jgi:hypothetical protein